MTKDEALKVALDAFGEIAWSNETQWQRDRSKEAITAIKEALAQPERDYERGFIDGMQKQMQSSVDKAVNAMAQRTWVGLTKTVVGNYLRLHALGDQPTFRQGFKEGAAFAEAKLKEKNT